MRSNGNHSRSADLAARVISYVVSPLLVPVATTGLVLYLVGASTGQSLVALAFIGLAFCVVPLAKILWMLNEGTTTSLDLPDRSDRTGPLAQTVVVGGFGLLLYQQLANGIDLIAILAATYIVNLLFVLAINVFWKISIHAIAISGMLAVALYLIGPVFGLTVPFEAVIVTTLVLLVPVVMWARLQLRLHTGAQVTAGALFGLLGHWLGFYFMTQLLIL